MYKLLIIEDDKGIADAIKTHAQSWDLQVHCIENFRNIMSEFTQFDPHIVLLDISLPFFEHLPLQSGHFLFILYLIILLPPLYNSSTLILIFSSLS